MKIPSCFYSLPLIVIAFGLSSCNVGGGHYNPKLFAEPTAEVWDRVENSCNVMFESLELSIISEKMAGIYEGDIPTRAMLELHETPTPEEASIIKGYEESLRSCRSAYKDAGIHTSAMDDIMEARISKVRFGLYQGAIPYSVYNYAVVQALKEQSSFQTEQAQAYQLGAQVGAEKIQKLTSRLRQQQMQMQMNSLKSQLNSYQQRQNISQIGNYDSSSYNSFTSRTSWDCSGSTKNLGKGYFEYDFTCK